MAGAKLPSDAVYDLADPFTGNARRDRRSALKRTLDRIDQASLQNLVACPYGCGPVDQDRMGYCRHLVGFCESETLKDGEVKTVPADVVVEEVERDPDEHNRRPIVGRGKLQRGDYLLRITSSLRVYRKESEAEPVVLEKPVVAEKPKAKRKYTKRARRGQTVLKSSTQRKPAEEPEPELVM